MKFDDRCKQLLEAMSRRNFLGLMGKGAAAVAGSSIVPAGVASSILKATTSPNIAFHKAVMSFADLVSLAYCSAEDPTCIAEIPSAKDIYGILANLTTSIHQKNPKMLPSIHTSIGCLDDIVQNVEAAGLFDAIAAGKKRGSFDPRSLDPVSLDPDNTESLQILADWCQGTMEELIPTIVRHGAMTQQLARDLKEKGFDVDNFLEKPPQPNTPPQADNIDYSRFDRAGGSEDEGYAKYFENFKIKR